MEFIFYLLPGIISKATLDLISSVGFIEESKFTKLIEYLFLSIINYILDLLIFATVTKQINISITNSLINDLTSTIPWYFSVLIVLIVGILVGVLYFLGIKHIYKKKGSIYGEKTYSDFFHKELCVEGKYGTYSKIVEISHKGNIIGIGPIASRYSGIHSYKDILLYQDNNTSYDISNPRRIYYDFENEIKITLYENSGECKNEKI